MTNLEQCYYGTSMYVAIWEINITLDKVWLQANQPIKGILQILKAKLIGPIDIKAWKHLEIF